MQVSPSTFVIAPGTVLADRYQLGQRLGRGGMAEVYDGVDRRLERPVAVKVLRREMVAREDVRTRFQAEARAAAGLCHPNAVAVYDTGEHEGAPFLVMERLPGDTLADLIAAGPVDELWLRGAAGGLLGALAAAHEAGIVHRDVKPGNVLIAHDGTAKITDFGIAKSIHPGEDSGGGPSDLTGTGQLLGTPAYLAPERLEGKRATPQSDLWAFGVVLYEALTGRKPFIGRNPLEVAHAIVNGNHVPLDEARPDLDPILVAVVERAMATDPEDRFATASEMAEALDGTLADGAVDDRTSVLTMVPDAPTRTVRTRGRRRVSPLVWVTAIVAVVLLAVFLAGDKGPFVPTTADRPTTTVALDPNAALAQSMREMAARLDPSRDGVRARDLADGLRRVADEVEARKPTAAGQAIGLITSIAAWRQAGELTDIAAAAALDLLRQVPGVTTQTTTRPRTASQQAPAAQTPRTVAPVATTAVVAPSEKKGRGSEKKNDD